MSRTEVLLVAGTHGNEINAPWLFDQLEKSPKLINRCGLKVATVIGNPLAKEKGLRYIDRDLNRSFSSKLLSSVSTQNDYEINRARELLSLFGPDSDNPVPVVIDFHSTTSAMGTCIVVYGRRLADLAFAALIQNRLNLPIYLHEGDNSQTGFLVEKWPCGLVIEIGPVPQGVLKTEIIEQTAIAVEVCLDELSKVKFGNSIFPKEIVIHRHLKSLDFPRDSLGNIIGYLHRDIDGKDWFPIKKGHNLFSTFNGTEMKFIDPDLPEDLIPVFINESAYLEKGIAMSLTTKECWDFKKIWSERLISLIKK